MKQYLPACCLGFFLLCICLPLSSCADGLILEPVPAYDQPRMVLPTEQPSPEPSPVTPLEIAQYQIKQNQEKFSPYLIPLSLALVLFTFFFRFLRLIYNLSTTTPDP